MVESFWMEAQEMSRTVSEQRVESSRKHMSVRSLHRLIFNSIKWGQYCAMEMTVSTSVEVARRNNRSSKGH